MRMQEIITNPPRDEYLDNYRNNLDDAVEVATIRGLTLKKSQSSSEIVYGLFDADENLVGYLSLHTIEHPDAPSDIWEVSLSQLALAYRGQGYATFLYDYAVMNDKLKVLSDGTQTGGPHGSRDMWLRLRNNNRYQVIGYDADTFKVIPDATPEMIYNMEHNTRWLALPPGESINEAITRIQSKMIKRYVVWYGPGTTTETYFNY